MAAFAKKALPVLRCKALDCTYKLAYQLTRFIHVTMFGDPVAGSTRSSQIVHFLFLALMLVLSPDKIPQMIGSTQSGFAIFDMIEEIPALLRKIIPF